MTTDPQAALRGEICRVGKSLFERGYAHGTAGNLSVRLPGGQGFLITPTDACLGWLVPEALAWVDAQGRQVSGERASKTLALHRRIYEAEPGAHAVIHTHSTHCVALTLLHDGPPGDAWLPPLTPYFVMKLGRVPLLPYHRPGDPTVGDRVAEAIVQARAQGRPLRAVMLDRLGPNVWHTSLALAMAALEELEETARLCWMTRGQAAPLSAERIAELHAAFGRSTP